MLGDIGLELPDLVSYSFIQNAHEAVDVSYAIISF